MNAEFYTGNRKKFLEKLDEGSVVLLHSGILPVKSNDQNMHPFSVNRNFYYLTGIETENVWLVLTKTATGSAEALFIDQPDEFLIKWNGKMLTKEEASAKSGLAASAVKYMQDMDRYVAGQLSASRMMSSVERVYFAFDRLSMNAAPTPAEQYALRIREKFPAIEVKSCSRLLASLRAIKTPEEVA